LLWQCGTEEEEEEEEEEDFCLLSEGLRLQFMGDNLAVFYF
jgi:hypothetical protein